MRKIYHDGQSIIFAPEAQRQQLAESFGTSPHPIVVSELRLTNLGLFSDPAKPILVISDNWEKAFDDFASDFRLIEAAGGVVRNLYGEVLMIFRNNKWDLPKGKLEEGELIETCAVREVEEECGITGIELGKFIAHSFHTYKIGEEWILKRTWWWAMECRSADSQPLTPQTEEGITRVEWADAKRVTENIKNTYPTISELFESFFAS